MAEGHGELKLVTVSCEEAEVESLQRERVQVPETGS